MLDTKTLLGISSIVLSIIISYILSNYIRTKRPNNKYGLVSTEIVLAFTIVTVIALITKDPFLITITVFLAFLVSRYHYDTKKSYIYQIFFSIVIGIVIPYTGFVVYEKFITQTSFSQQVTPIVEISPAVVTSVVSPVVEKTTEDFGLSEDEKLFLKDV
jgi:hypothetical protein